MNTTIAALMEALEHAQNGLQWYRDAYPDADSGADDEMHEQIDAALALARAEQAELVKHADNCGVFDERDFCTCTSPPAPVQAVEPLTESEMNRSWFLACKEIIDRCVAPDMYADARAMLDKALYESMIAAAPPLPKGVQ